MAAHFREKRQAFLPTPQQELLLKACLFEGADALAAWHAWRSSTNLDDVDIHSMRLLPLLAHNLELLGVEDPGFNKYRGIQRRTWARNHMLFRAAGRALQQLEAARIPAMALKGVVLASTYYQSMSLRPMDDFDLLVQRADGEKALSVLVGLGWRVLDGQFQPRVTSEFAVRAACALEDSTNVESQVDLHWRLLWARFSDEAETALWKRAVPFEISGTKCLAPCAADMLVHVCSHGAKWSDIPAVRWVIDAALLIRSGSVDWTHVCSQTERMGLALPLVETLNYLRTVMGVSVPDSVIQKLMQCRVKSIERLLYESELQSPAQQGLLSTLRIHQHIAWHELARSEGLSGYWHYFFALRRGRSLPELASWMARRLGQGATS